MTAQPPVTSKQNDYVLNVNSEAVEDHERLSCFG